MGRRSLWLTFWLALAAGLSQVATGVTPDMQGWTQATVAWSLVALALLVALYHGVMLAMEWRKGKRTVSDDPKEPTYRIEGDAVVSFNQQGGQTAREIHNYGPPKRVITPQIQTRMLEVLRKTEPGEIGVAVTDGDIEALEHKHQLMDLFRAAGWTVHDQFEFQFFGARRGLVLQIAKEAPEIGAPQVVLEALSLTGQPVAGSRGLLGDQHGMCIMVWTGPER